MILLWVIYSTVEYLGGSHKKSKRKCIYYRNDHTEHLAAVNIQNLPSFGAEQSNLEKEKGLHLLIEGVKENIQDESDREHHNVLIEVIELVKNKQANTIPIE